MRFDGELSQTDYDRKLDYLVDKYELDGIIEYLRQKWEAEGDDRWSIRDCGEHINKTIIDTVLNDLKEQPVSKTEDIVATLLADDDDPKATNQARLKLWFRKHGVDPDELTNDLIHYRTVYNYLTEIENAESPSEIYDEEELIERAKTRERRKKDRNVRDIEDWLAFHERNGGLQHTEYTVIPRLLVQCEKCGQIDDFSDIIAEGCDCISQSDANE